LTSNRFFIKKEHIQSSSALLSGREHHHLSKVARIQIKDKVWLFDEWGTSYLAVVEDIQPQRTRLLIVDTKEAEDQPVRVTLAQAIIKHKFMDLIVQKGTEQGVNIFIPLLTERTEVKAREGTDNKKERWEKIALEAVKQCGRALLPDIRLPLKLEDLLGSADDSLKLFLSEKSGNYLRDVINPNLSTNPTFPPKSVLLLVGPEGGFTDKEERDILERDFKLVNLGRYTYRSETAAIASTAMINHFWNT
jgi:16S rRNA (uracil1498-N3)-methyltransferase